MLLKVAWSFNHNLEMCDSHVLLLPETSGPLEAVVAFAQETVLPTSS